MIESQSKLVHLYIGCVWVWTQVKFVCIVSKPQEQLVLGLSEDCELSGGRQAEISKVRGGKVFLRSSNMCLLVYRELEVKVEEGLLRVIDEELPGSLLRGLLIAVEEVQEVSGGNLDALP